jgi:hypothetical protein
MSRLIAVILLSILMFPLAVLVFFLTFFTYLVGASYRREQDGLVLAGFIGCAFVAVYWLALWHKTVNWTPQRRINTILAALGAALAAFAIGFLMGQAMHEDDIEFSIFVMTLIAPLIWVFATILIWRETPDERAARLNQSASAIVCPTCGYNLTGLSDTRCPECGAQFTLDQLLANQPKREQVEIEG